MHKARPKRTLFDRLELLLARVTGYAAWPSTEAVLESEINVNSSTAQARSQGARFAFWTYKVDGKTYTAVVRRFFPPPLDYLHLFGRKVIKSRIQYDPARPGNFYYAPACKLAHTVVMILGLGALILLNLEFHPF
jgi:hypothetical protein